MATSYCTVAELRTQLSDTNNRLDATELQSKIDTASRNLEDVCGRRFDLDASATARLYDGGRREILIDDIGSVTGLVVESTADGTTWTTVASSNYELRPLNAAGVDPNAYAWWWLAESPAVTVSWASYVRIRVTARWGWSAVPDPVSEACLLRAAALVKRKDAPFGVAGFDGFGAVRLRATDPDVAALLGPYIRPEGFA